MSSRDMTGKKRVELILSDEDYKIVKNASDKMGISVVGYLRLLIRNPDIFNLNSPFMRYIKDYKDEQI